MGRLHERPKVAVPPLTEMLRRLPAQPTFAVAAKYGQRRTHALRTELTLVATKQLDPAPLNLAECMRKPDAQI